MNEEQKAAVPPVEHPVVRTHPETGRRCLFLGDHAEYISGLEYAEGRSLIERLHRQVSESRFIYRHKWRPKDLVIWDNRCLLHRATPFDTARERRVMLRCTVLGDEPR